MNYFGQGALLLHEPAALANPFFLLAPPWARLPLVILSSIATVIASQAVISGAFSMTRQAVQLGYLPRLEIRHTSEHEVGQIYVPKLNLFLLVAVLALVLGFHSSDNLGAAYGIAVTGTMTITTILAFAYMRGVLRWNFYWSLLLFGFFLAVDLLFFSANLLKIEEGGWFPLAVAVVIYHRDGDLAHRPASAGRGACGRRPAARKLHHVDQARPAGARSRHGGLHHRQQQHGAERAIA